MIYNYLQLIWLRGVASLKADANKSYLGTLWWILDPLMLTGLFYLAFASGIRTAGAGEDNFVIFLVCGLYPLKWTTSTLANSASALTSNRGIMGQMHFPKWIFPMIVNVTLLLRFCIVIPILLLFVHFSGAEHSIHWSSLLTLIICQLLFNIGVSLVASGWVPIVPDFAHIVPLLSMALLFTSGIFFDINDRPVALQEILRINPFVSIVENYRNILLDGNTLDLRSTFYPLAWSISLIFTGLLTLNFFNRYYPRILT